MRVLTTSVAAFAVATLVTGTAAFACDFHVMASAEAATPAPVKEQVVQANKIDPALLAYLKRTTQPDQPAETTQAE
jgi:hypothetical protein